MAHFVKISENNEVLQTIIIDNNILGEPDISFPETEKIGQDFIKNNLNLLGNWLQTSYNNNFRGKFATPGMIYYKNLDMFLYKKPYESWILNDNNDWVPPISIPDEALEQGFGKFYKWEWSEENKNWIKKNECPYEGWTYDSILDQWSPNVEIPDLEEGEQYSWDNNDKKFYKFKTLIQNKNGGQFINQFNQPYLSWTKFIIDEEMNVFGWTPPVKFINGFPYLYWDENKKSWIPEEENIKNNLNLSPRYNIFIDGSSFEVE